MACSLGVGDDFVLKYMFRRVSLTTVMFEHLIEFPRVKDVVGVFAGDVHPEIDDEVEVSKWIWNTNRSTEPGKHWVLCILCKTSLGEESESSACKNYEYEILDSWGSSHVSMVIQKTINLFFKKQCQGHSVFGVQKRDWDFCKCELSIVCSIQRRILHLSYLTCGWFALYFSTFCKDSLKEWLKNVKYGSIRDNEEELYNYFNLTFFEDRYLNYFDMRQCCYLRNKSDLDQICLCPPK